MASQTAHHATTAKPAAKRATIRRAKPAIPAMEAESDAANLQRVRDMNHENRIAIDALLVSARETLRRLG